MIRFWKKLFEIIVSMLSFAKSTVLKTVISGENLSIFVVAYFVYCDLVNAVSDHTFYNVSAQIFGSHLYIFAFSSEFQLFNIQSTLIISTSIISNNRVSRRENMALLLT